LSWLGRLFASSLIAGLLTLAGLARFSVTRLSALAIFGLLGVLALLCVLGLLSVLPRLALLTGLTFFWLALGGFLSRLRGPAFLPGPLLAGLIFLGRFFLTVFGRWTLFGGLLFGPVVIGPLLRKGSVVSILRIVCTVFPN
jgi:hypothetical protein